MKRRRMQASSTSSMKGNKSNCNNDILPDEQAKPRLDKLRSLVAQPIPSSEHSNSNSSSTEPWTDPHPALAGGCVLIGNKYHAADIANLRRLGVTAVLNCASGGISRLPVDELKAAGIRYAFTNVRQDDYSYPILHDHNGDSSKHLQVAKELYGKVKQAGGKVLFFCVAGQVRAGERERERACAALKPSTESFTYSHSDCPSCLWFDRTDLPHSPLPCSCSMANPSTQC